MKTCILFAAAGLAFAAEPDGLVLPAGFHASIVSEGLGPIRHLAVRPNGDLYISTPVDKQNKGAGIIVLHLDANHKADRVEHFGVVAGGTGIRFNKGALYAASGTGVYRFTFDDNGALLPGRDPDIIIDGMPRSTLASPARTWRWRSMTKKISMSRSKLLPISAPIRTWRTAPPPQG